MSTTTEYLGLTKPDIEDKVSIHLFNENFNKIDGELSDQNDQLNTILQKGPAEGSALRWRNIPSGENIKYGCWATGMYVYGGYHTNAPSNWGGVLITFQNIKQGSTSYFLKVSIGLDCTVHVMKQDSTGKVVQDWVKL